MMNNCIVINTALQNLKKIDSDVAGKESFASYELDEKGKLNKIIKKYVIFSWFFNSIIMEKTGG